MSQENFYVMGVDGIENEHRDCRGKLNPPFLEIFRESAITMPDGKRGFEVIATYMLTGVIRWRITVTNE